MKRILFIFLIACAMMQVMWGQESSQGNAQSLFVGEWTGTYIGADYLPERKLVIRIDSYGQEYDVRVKEIWEDESEHHWHKCIVTASSESEISFTYAKWQDYYDKGTHFRSEISCKLQQQNGKRLHLIPVKIDRYETSPNGNTSLYTQLINNDNHYLNIYLYKNEDNW